MPESQVSHSYKADLPRAGALVAETLVLLREYACAGDWEQIRQKAIRQNLLQKRSSHTTDAILHAVRHRFLDDHKPLPLAALIAQAVCSNMPMPSKEQVLFAYVVTDDALIDAAIRELVRPKLQTNSSPKLSKEDVLAFLLRESQDHPELCRWSVSLRRRWAQGFLALLRAFRILEPHPSLTLRRPMLRVEAFVFFLLGLLNEGFSAREALSHPLWDLYFLLPTDKDALLYEAQSKGWIHYQRAADVVELIPRFSLEAWLSNGLG